MQANNLQQITINGLTLQIPTTWEAHAELYTEPDGRICGIVDISVSDDSTKSVVISYGPMPEGSDALMEAGGTYEELIGELGPEPEDDPICEYDFLDTAYGFEVPTEDGLACNFICTEVGTAEEKESGVGCRLFTIMTTGKSYKDIDDLLDLVEQNISFA